jgi:DNA-binding MarR family transcriptional regulator
VRRILCAYARIYAPLVKPAARSSTGNASGEFPAHAAAMPDGETEITPLQCTGASVRRLARRMTSFYEHHMRSTGLKLSQYSVLAHLSETPQTLMQLAQRLEMDRTTLTRSIKPLLASGWVARTEGSDGRQHLLVLTAAGKQVRKAARQSWKAAQLALEAELGREFVATLHTQLDHALSQLKPALQEEN